jgi:hypothetical protein
MVKNDKGNRLERSREAKSAMNLLIFGLTVDGTASRIYPEMPRTDRPKGLKAHLGQGEGCGDC